ncbi:hypothetical protein AB0910_13865 [Streptomyces sp. NPDC047002]|uniref:hypothetical protein n=1 Tax=Streptomyces sp. NPDC047002 TaxID=3155475 RepID=UPI0034516EB2
MPDTGKNVTEDGRYEVLEECVIAWYRAGEDALAGGCWQPTLRERCLVGDILKSTIVPTPDEPPYDGEPLWCPLARVSRWAPVFRLASLAGGWDIERNPRPPAGYENMNLRRLTDGLYPFFALIEQCSDLHTGVWQEQSEKSADTRLQELIPSPRTRLRDAERVHIHSITMMLSNVLKTPEG